MSGQPSCEMCGHPAAAHTVVIYRGVAHTYPPGGGPACSDLDAERHYQWGRLAILDRIVRGMRNRASRLANRGFPSAATYLRGWADALAREAEQGREVVAQYQDRAKQ